MSKPFVTASAIERVVECPASAVLPQTQSSSVYSKKGNYEHAHIEEIILGKAITPRYTLEDLAVPADAVPEVAFSYDCVTGEANEHGRISDRDYPKSSFSTIFGTADLVGKSTITNECDIDGYSASETVDIVDWKTTYEPPPPDSWQMRLLAFMAARARNIRYARTRITHIRNGIRHSAWKVWTEADFAETEVIVRKTYDSVNKLGWKKEVTLADVRHGPHCHFCPAYLSCPYPKALLQANGFGDTAALLSNVDAVVAYNRWQALRTLSGRLEDAVKGYALQKPIQLGNGYLYGKPGESANFRKFKMYNPEEDE